MDIADIFYEFDQRYDALVDELVMTKDDFLYLKETVDVELSGAPLEPGEIVGYLWGATIRLSNRINRGELVIKSEFYKDTHYTF